jgi:hypothetical protein
MALGANTIASSTRTSAHWYAVVSIFPFSSYFSSLESGHAESSLEESLYLPLILSASWSGGPNRATFQNAQKNSLETCVHISLANKTVKGGFFGVRNN